VNFIGRVFFSWALARMCGVLSSDWKPIARVKKYHIYSPVDVYYVLVVNIVCTFSCTVDHCIYWCLTCYLTLCSYTEFAGWLKALLYVYFNYCLLSVHLWCFFSVEHSLLLIFVQIA